MHTFGESAPAGELFKEFGFTVENVVKAPSSPTRIPARSSPDTADRSRNTTNRNPISADPATLTTSVPQGNSRPSRP